MTDSAKRSRKGVGGRPTKYRGKKTIRKVDELVKILQTPEGAKKFFTMCGIEQVAIYLGVVKDTVYEWMRIHPEFSAAIKRWQDQRNAVFYQGAGSMPVATWIFLAKNWLNMSDRQVIRTPDSDPRSPTDPTTPAKLREDDYSDEELLKIASRGRVDSSPKQH